MTLDASGVQDALVSQCLALGLFARVNGHEPKSAPPSGLTAAVWVDYIGPSPLDSGLAATAGLLRFKIRLYTGMLSEPQDAIDPMLLSAVVVLLAALSGDFTLGATVRNVDLMGAAAGSPLSAQAGYLNQDGKLFRIMDITLPLIINDIWDQSA